MKMPKREDEDIRSWYLLIAAYIALHVALLLRFGIVTGYESAKYIEQADSLLNTGQLTSPNFVLYAVQILLIAAVKKTGLGYGFAVAVQILANAASVYCFHRIVRRYTASVRTAFWFTMAFIGMFYYHLYNVHLFTESLYFSFSILYFYGLLRVTKLGVRSVMAVAAGLFVLYFTRPVGIFFIPATFVFLVLRFWPRKAVVLFSSAGLAVLALFFLLLNKSLDSGGELDFLLPYASEMVICGIPTAEPPHAIQVPVNQNSVQGLLYVATHHTGLFFSLGLKRLAAFFGAVRSYYSLPHNLFAGLYFYTLYVLVLVGIRRWTKARRPEVFFALTLIVLTAGATMLSCDEWHNRFLFTLLPFLLFLGSLGFGGNTETSVSAR